MSYKNNYELWNPALATRRPSQMSEIDIVLAQTYPHVAMLPYSSCCHCSYEEEEDEFMSPSSSTIMSDESIRSRSTQNSNRCAGSSNKRSKIRSRLRKLLKSSSRSG